MTHDYWTAGAEIEKRDMEIAALKARLAEAEWLLQVTWELETNQYKYPVDEYGDRLEAFVRLAHSAEPVQLSEDIIREQRAQWQDRYTYCEHRERKAGTDCPECTASTVDLKHE